MSDDVEPAWKAALRTHLGPPMHGPRRALSDDEIAAAMVVAQEQCRVLAARAVTLPWRPFLCCQTWRVLFCGARGMVQVHAFAFVQPPAAA